MFKIIKYIITASGLGAGIYDKVKVALALFLYFLAMKFKFSGAISFSFKIKKFGKIARIKLSDFSDTAIFNEIFVKGEYDVDTKKSPEIIFDLGSNVGLSVIFFKIKYPHARVYAFEPDPETFKKLVRNTEQFSDVLCYNLAVSNNNGREKFYIYPQSSMSSSLVKRIENEPFIEVESKTMDTLMAELGVDKIDFLKIDVEGAEFNIIKSFKNLLKVNKIIGEVHVDLMGGVTKEEFLALFDGFRVLLKNVSAKRFVLDADNNKA